MSVKNKAKKAAGFIKEEIGEAVGDQEMMNEGRAKRNEGRIADGELPKLTKPGTGN